MTEKINRRHLIQGAGALCALCGANAHSAMAQEAVIELELCTELALDDTELSLGLASDEYPGNKPVRGPEATFVIKKRWNPKRRVLSVDFVSEPGYLDEVVSSAKKWEEFANIKFSFGKGEPDILVAFDPGGSWSYVGTDSLDKAKKGQVSMNFGWLRSGSAKKEVDRVVLHEFGHALSLGHEHSHPASGIPWDKSAVYAYYDRKGYKSTWVDDNVFKRYAASQVNGEKYDKKSIMHYPIPKELLLDASFAVGWNTELSEGDMAVAKKMFNGAPA